MLLHTIFPGYRGFSFYKLNFERWFHLQETCKDIIGQCLWPLIQLQFNTILHYSGMSTLKKPALVCYISWSLLNILFHFQDLVQDAALHLAVIFPWTPLASDGFFVIPLYFMTLTILSCNML